MPYTKTFKASIILFRDFNNDSYCEYFKEQLNEWLVDCYNAYTDFFSIKVYLGNKSALLYSFDVEDGDYDLDFKKVWQKSPSSLSIEINGSGIVNHGLKNNLEPPSNISDDILDKIYLKYQETSDKYPAKIIAYGKNPETRKTEVPIVYTFDGYDTEKWEDTYLDTNVYSERFKLSVVTSYQSLVDVYNIFERIIELNKNSLLKIYADHMENYIELKGQFILKKEDKDAFFELLKELAIYVVEDDFFKIEESEMNFIAEDPNLFYFEKYYLNDINGDFEIRSISV